MGCLDENAVGAFIEGRLGGEARAEIEAHVETCPECRRLLGALARAGAAAPPSGSDARVAPGDVIDRFRIVRRIGAGGMGVVYLAHDPRLDREVAVKVLPAAFSSDPDRLRRFETEARAAGALNHPNVLAVYDVGEQDGKPYLVTELLEGETLRERLRLGPVPWRKALEWGREIAAGLAAAHDKRIIHRDLKPENLFVTKDGRVKILDFGLAKNTAVTGSVDDSTLAATEPGAILGTAGYMSPEQVRGRPADARSDIFSFGAVLFEALSGRRAFEGDSHVERAHAILTKEPPELTVSGVDVPPAVERLIRRCLEKSPDERFGSARDLAFAIEALSGIDSATSSPGAIATSAPASGATPTPTSAPGTAPAPRPRRVGALVAAVLAVLVIGAVGWLATRKVEAPPRATIAAPAPSVDAAAAPARQPASAAAPPVVQPASAAVAPTPPPAVTGKPAVRGRPTPRPGPTAKTVATPAPSPPPPPPAPKTGGLLEKPPF